MLNQTSLVSYPAYVRHSLNIEILVNCPIYLRHPLNIVEIVAVVANLAEIKYCDPQDH